MRRIVYLLLFCILFFNSCVGGFGFVMKKRLFGNYYLIATDDIKGSALSYYNEETDKDNWGIIIGPTVFAVGFNEDYLIAKQYYNLFYEGKVIFSDPHNTLDSSNIRYYILPIREDMDWRTLNGLLGPLSYQEFEEKRREFNISSMKFRIEINI